MFFADLPMWGNAGLFAAAAAGVWVCGTYLTIFTDLIAERTGLGKAFAGVLMLGTATSLPEIGATATAATGGDVDLAGANLLGGIAMQIAVLGLVDAVVMRKRALTFFSPQPALLMQGVMLALLIALATAAIAAGEPGSLFGIGVWSYLVAAAYVGALYVVYRYEGASRWEPSGELAEPPQSAIDLKDAHARRFSGISSRRVWTYLAGCAAGVLVTGSLVALTGEALAEQTGLGSSFVGATLVSIATSLPEVSTTFTAVRTGAYSMAVGNIFGSNAFGIALLPFADVFYREGLVFDALDPSIVFLAALGIVNTCVYLWGMLERRDKTVFGMGQDSAATLVIYFAGIVVYYFIRPQ